MILNENFLKSKIRLKQSRYYGYTFQISAHDEILNENTRIYNARKKYDVFLSHSYLDKDLIYVLMDLFNKAGYSVYVDWKEDQQLDRSNVDENTADILRKRMNVCRGLAYIASANSSSSKWCPWELGYFDGKKNGKCAILPVLKGNLQSFKGQEYLSLYPYIDYHYDSNTGKDQFWINNPNNGKYISLKAWLNGVTI